MQARTVKSPLSLSVKHYIVRPTLTFQTRHETFSLYIVIFSLCAFRDTVLKDQTGYNLLKKMSEFICNYLSRDCNSLSSTNYLGMLTTLSKTSCTFLSVCLPNEFPCFVFFVCGSLEVR